MKQFKIFFILCLLASCKEKAIQFDIAEEHFEPIVWHALPDTLLPPKITPLSATKGPKKITNVSKRTIPLKHPFGVGVPSITSFGMADGLPSQVVQDLEIDQEGKLWIGGFGNLSSFDGSTFTNYTSSNGIESLSVSKLFFDSKNMLWLGIAIKPQLLYTYGGQNFQPVNLGLSDSVLGIMDLIEDAEGSVWIGARPGLYRIANDSITEFGTEEGLANPWILNLLIDPEGIVIANTLEGSFRFDGKKFNPVNFIYDQKKVILNQGLVDREGNFWGSINVNGKKILGKFDQKTFIPLIELKESDFQRVIFFEDSSGKIWISSDDSLFIFSEEKLVQYTYKDLGISPVTSFGEDQTGNIWLGTLEGLFKFSFSYTNLLENVLPTTESYITVFAIDAQGIKWEAKKDQLVRYDQDEALVYDLSKFLEPNGASIVSMYSDHSGNLWMTLDDYSNRTMLQFDGADFYSFDSSLGIDLTLGFELKADNKGNPILTGSGGITLFDGTSFTQSGKAQGFPELVSSVIVDQKNQLWAGTAYQGVFVYTQDSVMQISTKQGLLDSFVNMLVEGPFGNIWIGTDKGLSKFDGKKLTNFPETEGLASIISAIAVDYKRKLIWINTDRGLISLPFDQIDEINPKVSKYAQSNGFEPFAGSFISSRILFDSTGLWTNDLNSIQRLEVDKVKEFPTPTLELKNIRLNNQEVIWSLIAGEGKRDSLTPLNESALKFSTKPDRERVEAQATSFGKVQFDRLQKGSLIPENLQLPFKNNSITFQFALNSLSFGQQTQYRYKLEGYEENWSPLSTKDEAFFGNMSEGEYTFRLEAISPYGTTSELTYSFVVLPPWYRTWWAYLSYFILFLSIIFGFIKWRERKLKWDKEVLEKTVEDRTAELKASQAQLIQSEKMASLGELTAGIAHEIQNPLNFVNNFSELNKELVEEATEELEKGDLEETKAILKDLGENSEKINHHGKRAGAIVKGMLEHSRTNKGEKALTDLNALAEEYLKLSYHGLRAKDKSFSADFKLELDPDLPKVEVIAPDIGRVILNLVNNAFYACTERSRSTVDEKAKADSAPQGYKPEVIVSSKKTENGIELSVQDNGGGIPEQVRDKIFQPFFTTKPTGSGTGLGLSLSYDIVKAHGGNLAVTSSPGHTVFTIHL